MTLGLPWTPTVPRLIKYYSDLYTTANYYCIKICCSVTQLNWFTGLETTLIHNWNYLLILFIFPFYRIFVIGSIRKCFCINITNLGDDLLVHCREETVGNNISHLSLTSSWISSILNLWMQQCPHVTRCSGNKSCSFPLFCFFRFLWNKLVSFITSKIKKHPGLSNKTIEKAMVM